MAWYDGALARPGGGGVHARLQVTKIDGGVQLARQRGRRHRHHLPAADRPGALPDSPGRRGAAGLGGPPGPLGGQPHPGQAFQQAGCFRERAGGSGLVAVGNTQLKVYHKLLSSPGMRYEDLGPDYYQRRTEVSRQVRHHVGKLGALGFEVTLGRLPGADPDPSELANTQTA